MTDSGLTGQPAKNTGGDYPVRKSAKVTLDGRPRTITHGQLRGSAIRNALQVGQEFDLLTRMTTASGVEDVRMDDNTVYSVADGRSYRTALRGMADDPPAPVAIPEAGGKPYPYPLPEPGAETVIGEDGRVVTENAPEPKSIQAGTLEDRVTFLEEQNQKRVEMAKRLERIEKLLSDLVTGFGRLPMLQDTVDDIESRLPPATNEHRKAIDAAIVDAARANQERHAALEATLARIEAQNREALDGRSAIFDEAKRARTLAEENEALGRAHSRSLTDLLEKAVAVKAVAAKTDTRLWNQAGLLTDILKALGGPDALLQTLGRIEKAVAQPPDSEPDDGNISMAPDAVRSLLVMAADTQKTVARIEGTALRAVDSANAARGQAAEPVFAGPEPEKPRPGPVVFYNGAAIRGLPAEIDDRSLREKMGVPFDDALIEVQGDGVVMERILDGEKIEITDGKRFVSVPNPRFVPRR